LTAAAPSGPVAAAPIVAVVQHAIPWIQGDDGEEAAAPAAPALTDLGDLVESFADQALTGKEEACLAKAVYFEARGEPIQGQLAVAQVVLNRAASGRYPASWCRVITQKAQFSFIHRGRFPAPNRKSEAWRKAVGVAHIAKAGLVKEIAPNVLWYHATYVSPSWGRSLTRETQIGLHIFYS
jgi:spore germination cell wall hydrolase CwlJ-like protein